MIGWCYDPASKLIWITPYININGKKVYGREIYKYPLGTKLRIKLFLDESSKTCYFTIQIIDPINEPVVATSSTYFIPYKRTYYLINFYFGGNRAAPKCVAVNVENK